MLNPYLEARLFALPVRPLLVEVQSQALNTVVGGLRTLGVPVQNVTPLFSMLGVPPVPAKLIRVINALPGVRAVHADLESHALVEAPPFVDTSVFFPTAESRKVLEADVAESEGWTGEAVKTAVIDTGIDPSHPQLQGAEWETVIQVPVREMLDKNGHGSHVASTATGRLFFADPPGLFVEGVSSSRLLSIKALGRGVGTGFTSEIVNAMARALESGAKVVNMSLGSEECQGGCTLCPECRAVTRLTEAGILVAIAAGNSGPSPDTIGCPGCSPDAITVAAVDKDGVVADFSSRGGARFPGKPDVAAPGVDIFSGTARASFVDLGDAKAGPGFAAISGTSMATPHVAGLLALLKHRNPNFTTAMFKEAVATRGTPFNALSGRGIARWSWF
jgi:subtilisin family serine protease